MIVDTSALVAVSRKEEHFEPLLDAMLVGDAIVPAPVLVEYHRVTALAGNRPDPDAEALVAGLIEQGARVSPFDRADAEVAVAANPTYGSGNGQGGRLNMLDLMVYAVAKRTGLPILCTGRDFAATDAKIHPGEPHNMTDLKSLLKPDKGQAATPLHLVDKKGFEPWLKGQPARVRKAVEAQGFRGEGFQLAILPGERDEWGAVLGVANAEDLSPWCLAKAAESLPEGIYRVAGRGPGAATLGWLLGQYRFDRYRKEASAKGSRVLLTDEPARIDETVRIAEATALVRDLVNIPAGDLGPAELELAALALADESGAKVVVTRDRALDEGYPMIAAVGRAAAPGREPRLIELEYGDTRHPRIAIVGKGVTFDSGGLDIKPSSGMRLMKKDMGGAAHALALAGLIIKAKLPVRLHLLIPAVENSISGAAFRPGDILSSRKGLSVEVGNTDAEGRLILADALTRAVEEAPELILDFATLTGAARVALGPDLPALFANDDALAEAMLTSGASACDPLWRMPLWSPYDEMLASDIADLGNVSDAPLAGAVTAALFLQKFVPAATPWAHLDTFAWRPSAKPGRPKGGEALGLRAAWAMLRARYGT